MLKDINQGIQTIRNSFNVPFPIPIGLRQYIHKPNDTKDNFFFLKKTYTT